MKEIEWNKCVFAYDVYPATFSNYYINYIVNDSRITIPIIDDNAMLVPLVNYAGCCTMN